MQDEEGVETEFTSFDSESRFFGEIPKGNYGVLFPNRQE